MNRDAEALRHVGESLYGTCWQTAMAADLNVALRTVQRWAVGEYRVPRGVWPELAEICVNHGRDLRELARELVKAPPE